MGGADASGQNSSTGPSEATRSGESGEVVKVQAPPKPASKPRIDAIDGCRFALVLPICVGHFIRFGTDRRWVLKLLTQENVLVGGFFIISGYVAGYVSTNLRERSHNKKLDQPELFFWQKVMGYYPLHAVVSTAFSPMFIIMDRLVSSWRTTIFHAFLNYSLLQAWFPSDAEIWNPPTWFLSALTFANLSMPTVMPQVARLSKDGLRKLYIGLNAISILGKVSYSQAWSFVCCGGVPQPALKPTQPHLWNVTRFHPFWALTEITMGMTAVRDVMLDEPGEKPSRNPLWYFLASYASLALRLTNFNLNDAMIRSLVFIPLYTKFLTTLHRDCISSSPHAITRFFGSKMMTYLGSLAFPMFILHGPLGQVFYKKKVATYLWGRVQPKSFFPMYLLIVLLSSWVVNETFVKNSRVQKLSAAAAQFLAARTEGVLQDKEARKA